MAGLLHRLIRLIVRLGPLTGERAETGMEISAAGIDKADNLTRRGRQLGMRVPPLAIVALFR